MTVFCDQVTKVNKKAFFRSLNVFLLRYLYEKINKKPAPYYFHYSILTIVIKPIRKYFTNIVAANCPFNIIRILIYRLCGFSIGKYTFIGMRCYLDDLCYKQMKIGNNCTISYGVYFACHGKNQGHNPITIKDNCYIGMCARIISPIEGGITIGTQSIVGACTLVNKSIPDNSTAVGTPCRVIKSE